MANDNTQTEIQDYSTELESGVFNLVISLVNHKANMYGYTKAREEVAAYLDGLSSALRNKTNL